MLKHFIRFFLGLLSRRHPESQGFPNLQIVFNFIQTGMNDRQINPIKKVNLICAKGTIEDVYATLILGNGAVMEGIEANLFFTLTYLAGKGKPNRVCIVLSWVFADFREDISCSAVSRKV